MHVRTIVATAAFLAFLPFDSASAAPQILAVISTDGAKPLVCEDGECYAEFTAFCMEPGRPSPTHRTSYTAAVGADLTLVATGADGREIKLPISKQASFLSQRGFAAVRIAVPEALVKQLGAEKAGISVGRRVALLPVEAKDDRWPHEPDEIAQALGPNREVGEEIVDRGGKTAQGARYLSYMINALPAKGAYSRTDPATRLALWDKVAASVPADVAADGRRYARRSYDRCLKNAEDNPKIGMRACLQQAHDKNVWKLNKEYWLAVSPQS